jgi:signal peptidase II
MITILIAAVVVVLDQISKFFVMRDLKPVSDIPVWDGVLHFHYAENTGASFGMFPGLKWVFLVVSILFVVGVFIFVLIKRKNIDTFALVTLGLICGGALGNAIDRIRVGYVIDFVYVKLINFAIFNVADSCIVVGGILLGVYVIFIYKEPHEKDMPKMEEGNENP